ncbi:hypothetical protein [Aequorivita capsosiphonis]|uniref:hypothetical protein n=1 Tax=Aequorivita capsosiphonis TaxID=487317 RepID=UPI0003FC5857|nr:hypothetical protein [Aequorivita capsosiphonis]
MNKHLRKISYIILAIGAVFIIATISINIILKNKLETFIQERLPENMIRSYDDITVESFGGSLSITNASLIIKNKVDSVEHTFINVEKLKISHISYWDYLFKNEIHIETISLESPIMAYYKDRVIPNPDTTQKGVFEIYKPILVDKIRINNSKFAIYEKAEDSTMLYSKDLSLELNGIRVDDETIRRKIPLDFKDYKAKSDSVFVKVGPYENLSVSDFSIKDRKAVFENIKLKTKYSKKELSKIIEKERDHYNLSLKSLSLDAIDFGFNDNGFFAKSKMVSLASPSAEIYRDKLVADDPKIKPLYSKMLRELDFELTIDSLKISDANITYEERVKVDNMGGSIDFKNLDAAISNVSNTYTSPDKTHLKITADFMEKTPISVDWNFDVQNESDQFLFMAQIGSLNANRMNGFTEPNLKVRLKGHTNKTYFTIDGNNDTSSTDLKINYSDFKVTILKKNGKEKNKFLSTIANIFISKDSEKKGDIYKEGTAKATRNKTKSIFNFLWISAKSALSNAML